MVFDDKIEEVGGFFGDGGVEFGAIEALIDGAQATFEAVVSAFAEEVAGGESGP